MSATRSVQQKRAKFRELLSRKSLTVMPGGFSPLYARLAEQAGFECFFLAGSQLSAFLYGVPDNGIIGLRELSDHARHIAAHTDIPIFIDADTGFGNAVNVHFTVQECIRSGVAALQIEDQEAPKKSGTAAGRRCIPVEEAVGKIRAAIAARDELDPEFAICARCDAIGAQGGGFEDALQRCIAYAREGGADFVWLNSVETREQLRRACAEIPAPVLTIWGGNDTPPTLPEYEELGVRIALYPVMAATSGLQAAWELLCDFKQRGTIALREWDARVARNPWGRPDTKALLGADKIREIEERYLPAGQRRDYASTWGHKTSYADADSAQSRPKSER
jgi:2-methylisocitrate lyase-like PEP mutase family enzyme